MGMLFVAGSLVDGQQDYFLVWLIVMGILGMFNIGNFVLYYGPDKLICVKE